MLQSRFLAPAFILASLGFLVPGTGDKFREELEGYSNVRYRATLMENITLLTQLDLFFNYLDNPENVDVNWQNAVNLKVNKLISMSIFTHLIYDDELDTEFDNNKDGVIDEKGPRLQFKETLGIGISFKIPNPGK